MAAFIFSLIFTAISFVSNLVTFIVFKVIACSLVLVIQSFKTSGQAVQGVLELLGGVIKWLFDHILEVAYDGVWSIVRYVIELLLEGVWGSTAATVSAIGGMLEKIKEALNGLMESDPEIFNGVLEMVGSIGGGFWSHCVDAVKYLMEKA